MDIFPINDNTEDRKQQMEHIYTMDHQRLVQQAVGYKPAGRKSIHAS